MSTGFSPSTPQPLPSPRTSRHLGGVVSREFSAATTTAITPATAAATTAAPSLLPSPPAPPSPTPAPVLVSRSVTASANSLVGQLLSASGNAGPTGTTPYGMIVSATGSSESATCAGALCGAVGCSSGGGGALAPNGAPLLPPVPEAPGVSGASGASASASAAPASAAAAAASPPSPSAAVSELLPPNDRHHGHREARPKLADKVQSVELKIPAIAEYTDLSPIYAIVRSLSPPSDGWIC